ncbi:MBL fold metallo-hydrolase [Mesorhizobium sp. L103C131B0]|uniref:MBL fold metallo-hydrolase n=1 Tax=Mesorhizobium sp. L103C131B0 TaxID=1287089 RepID=UPI0003FD30FB|nr:MBL fold metallo-hydrolase [Mesorhizobium sp. L103C131B0]
MRRTIRMYEVGFGDCFLLGFHDDAGSKYVLIDCGTITEKKAQLDNIVSDIIKTSGERLALVIATHRHKDHVWGFDDPRWANVEVGEVWMPWTEDPQDPRAAKIRERHSALALALAGAPSNQNPLEITPARETIAQARARNLQAIALNALTNEKAMATLHSGFAGEPPRAFLPIANTACEARTVNGLAGVTFHVLGPTRDAKALASMDPPEGAGYLKWPTRIPKRRVGPPFSQRYQISEPDYVPLGARQTFRLEDRAAIKKSLVEPSGMLAAALDKAINNTSLVMVIEANGHFMLFPGDAQWGSWQAIMADQKCRAVLEKVDLLKVGHHGSHNATPRALVEEIISKPLTALFSTKPVKQWPNIPREKLLAALNERHAEIARTDAELDVAGAAFLVSKGLYIEWTG